MRRILTLAVFLTPLLSPTAQTLRVDNGTLSVTSGVIDLGSGMLIVGKEGMLDEHGGRITTDASGGLMISPSWMFGDPMAAMNVGGLGLTITTAGVNVPGAVTVTRGHAPQAGNGNPSILRYFDVSAETNTGLDATVVFRYDDAELNSLQETDLVLYGSSDGGTSWVKLGGTIDTDRNEVTASGLDGLMRFTVASSEASLPVELVAFEATANGAAVVLRWETASETNNAGFAVEMKPAGDPRWQQVDFVEGHRTTATPQLYRRQVDGLVPGLYRFRLKQVDYDGAFTYSPEIEASLALDAPHLLSAAAPNPFTGSTQVALTVERTQHVTAAVYDVIGRQVAQLFDGTMEAGRTHHLAFDATGLPAGLYVLLVRAEHFHASQTVTLIR